MVGAAAHKELSLFYLASQSPRRRELLRQLGASFEVVNVTVPEVPAPEETAGAYVARLAAAKARAGAESLPGQLVMGADTVVVANRQILEKPQSPAHARAMLASLVGGSHTVLTGVALAGRAEASITVATEVVFRALSVAEIDAYVATGEGADKAGGYAIQGFGAALVAAIHGSYSNVVGLPLAEVAELLTAADEPIWQGRGA